MANLLIVPPAAIVGISASRGSGVENLLSPHPSEVWADAAVGSAATIDIDLGAARPVDTIFLGYVLPPAAGATWAITGGAANPTQQVVLAATALRVPDTAAGAPALSHAFWHGAAVNVRYLRITITQPAGSPALTAGIAFVGSAFSPSWNREWGSGRRPIDTGTATPLPDGNFAIAEGARKSSWYWTLGDLTDAELDRLFEITLAVGETRPVLVVEDPAITAGLRRRIHYGLFQQLRQFDRQSLGRTKWELSIEDWGADQAATL